MKSEKPVAPVQKRVALVQNRAALVQETLGRPFLQLAKHLLHPLLTTLGNFEVLGLCSRQSGVARLVYLPLRPKLLQKIFTKSSLEAITIGDKIITYRVFFVLGNSFR